MRIAALDLGSNSFHLLVVDAASDGSLVPVLREKEMLRLGAVVSRQGWIPPEAADRAVATVSRLVMLARSAGSSELIVCATAALRQADNGAEVVERIAAEVDVTVDVLSGTEEARLVFEGVRASMHLEPSPALCLDLGGGSLEVMVGSSAGLERSTSVDLGVARLWAELVRNDPLSKQDLRRLRERAEDTLVPVVEAMDVRNPALAVGTGGTARDLARLVAARRDPAIALGPALAVPPPVEQRSISRAELLAVHDELLAAPAADRLRFPGIDAGRVETVPVGAIVLVTAMELFGFDELTVSRWGLREGMVLEALGRLSPGTRAKAAVPYDGRRVSVVDLAQRCHADPARGDQVARLALALFDQTQVLHGLGPEDRQLLEYAALLHHIGRHVSIDAAHKHSAYLVQHGQLRGFSPEEVATMAALARYHRGSDPKPGHEPFRSLSSPRQAAVVAQAALLRVAAGLDTGHRSVVSDLDVDLDGETVVVTVEGSQGLDLALWGARRERQLFEKTFGRRIEFEAVVPSRRAG
ncbi:MAG: hypothetical protein ACRD0Q_06930 [Acidimicrobiales bacterium]